MGFFEGWVVYFARACVIDDDRSLDIFICSCWPYQPFIRNAFSSDFHRRSQTSYCGSLVADGVTLREDVVVKQGYRLIIVDKDGVLVSEFQLTEHALAQPEAFVEGIKASIDSIEEEES